VPLLLLGPPPFFLISLFVSTTLLTGMTSISLHMHWSLTSQSYGSFLEENNSFFHYRSNSMPPNQDSFSVYLTLILLKYIGIPTNNAFRFLNNSNKAFHHGGTRIHDLLFLLY
jgi:hypothetical protein